MDNKRGTLATIVLEGITGSGKSTQAELLVERLSKDYDTILLDRNNLAITASAELRKLLKKSGYPLVTESLLHQTTNWMKLESLEEEPEILIIDRFVLSNLVYLVSRCQLEGILLNREEARRNILFPFGFDALKDMTLIYIDCDPAVAYERTEARSERPDFDLDTQRMAREIYIQELESLGIPYHKVDGNLDEPAVIAEKVYQIVTQLLKGNQEPS